MDGYLVQVEADVGQGLPGFTMVGYLAAEVKEAEERMRTAIKNSGLNLPPMKVTLNLSPANIRKDGTAFDLPIALAVLGAYGVVDLSGYSDSAFIGELGLDGSIKGVLGVLPLVIALRECGIRRVFLPEENLNEGLAVDGIAIIKAVNIRQMISVLSESEKLVEESRVPVEDEDAFLVYDKDFSEVNGQTAVRRATEVAVAGQHNILYIGPPGSGKSMIAQRIPSIMPPMSQKEQIELSKVYSICGMLPKKGSLMKIRPFRSPHHTISPQALTGGGRQPKPGEVSLASHGVLFLDELAEFHRGTLEILRQPLEEHKVSISRVEGAYDFPAEFMLAAACNPCPCGYYPDRSRCSCNDQQVKRYLNRISRPLLDRFDICVEAAPVTYQEIRSDQVNESSASIRERILQAQQIQKERFSGTQVYFNSGMGNREVRKYCVLGTKEESLIQKMYAKLQLSARGYNRILKVARTIADLDGSERILSQHLTEALGYRDLEERYWGRG
jgi:magnesium chelatase family protein